MDETIPTVTYGEGGYDPDLPNANVVEATVLEIVNGIVIAETPVEVTNDGEPIDPDTGDVFGQ